MTDTDTLKEFGIGQVFNTEIQDELAKYVRKSYDDAKEHKQRTGVSALLLRNLRAKLCQYQPEDAEMVAGIDVYVGLAALKQRAADILAYRYYRQ